MGIRVHKLLGYGLNDVKYGEYNIVDDRFRDGVTEDIREWPKKWAFNKYVKWLKSQKFTDEQFEERLEQVYIKDTSKKINNIGECIFYQAEYGLPDVLVIVPPVFLGEWSRYDNIIDYYTECYRQSSTDFSNEAYHYEFLDSGIFPYNGAYIDSRDGRRIEGSMTIWKYSADDEHAKKIGFKNANECKNYLRPSVPACIQLFCEFADLFKEWKTVYQLRPMMYTYWS